MSIHQNRTSTARIHRRWYGFISIISSFIFLSLCLFFSEAQGGEVTLAWDPPTTEHDGFILAYGTSSGSYTQTQDVGNHSTFTVTNLDPGQTYYFAVKAYSLAQNSESSYSNQVSATLPPLDLTPPSSPQQLQILNN